VRVYHECGQNVAHNRNVTHNVVYCNKNVKQAEIQEMQEKRTCVCVCTNLRFLLQKRVSCQNKKSLSSIHVSLASYVSHEKVVGIKRVSNPSTETQRYQPRLSQMGENKNAREFGAHGTNQNTRGIRGRNPAPKKLLGRFLTFSRIICKKNEKRHIYLRFPCIMCLFFV